MKKVPGPTPLPKADPATRAAINRLEAASREPMDAVRVRFDNQSTDLVAADSQAALVELAAKLAGFAGPIDPDTYTPTLFNTANIDASTAYVSGYIRIGNIVLVGGQVDVDASAAAATATTLGVSIPIASNFASVQRQLWGVGAINGVAVSIQADATNDRATFSWPSNLASNLELPFLFGYLIVT